MAISPINSNQSLFDQLYTNTANKSNDASLSSSKIDASTALNQVSNTNVALARPLAGVTSGNSFNSAIQQALVQLNAGRDISAFFDSDEGQEASSSFGNSLLSQLPGLSNAGISDAQAATSPIKLDPNSSSIQLQSSIQKLITQLDSGNSANAAAGLGSLQEAFNSLVNKSGGEPSAQNLQSFLKLVAVNVQGSTSLGSIFSTSA